MLKKLVVVVVVLAMVLSFMVACQAKEAAPAEAAPAEEATVEEAPMAGGVVGVLMPTKDLQRWNQDGDNMKSALEAKGYEVDLQYASNDVATQVEQIENLITKGVDVLVVASIDGSALANVLESAKAEGILVIAYDRLIMDTPNIDYYATFDNEMVGTIQGNYIVETLGLDKGEMGPFTMEVFVGSPDDNNARLFNKGALDVLTPYMDSGVLVVKSGEGMKNEDWTSIGILGWKSESAQERMDNLLTTYYADENIDVVLSPNDSLAQGISASLDAAGYGTEDKPFPVLTGQDCDVNSMKNILAGKQSMSIFKDTRDLAARTVTMVDQYLAGETVETNATYDNNVFEVPSYLCTPVFADINNYKELLIDSGYYTEDQLQ